MVVAALLSAAEVALPYCSSVFPRGLFAALSALTVSSAWVARIVAQKEFVDAD